MSTDRDQAHENWRPPTTGTAVVLAALLFGGTVLWMRFGGGVYVERILGAIAGCF